MRHTYLTLSAPPTVDAGGTLIYTVTLRSDAVEIRLVDVTLTLPVSVNVVQPSDGGDRRGDTIVWTNVTLLPSVERKLYVSISVDPYVPDGVLLASQVTADGESAAATTRIVSRGGVPLPRDLRVRVSDGKDYAAPEELLRYVFLVDNIAPYDRLFTLRVTLPANLIFLSATGNFRLESNVLSWSDEPVRGGDSRSYEMTAYIDRDAPDFANVTVKASVNGYPASDLTVVQRSEVLRAFDVSISHDRNSAAPGSDITYQITLQNDGDVLATNVDVSAALPMYAEFVDASNGGVWTGNNVRWMGLTVSPHGRRVLTVVAHVRTDAPIGADLRMTAEAKGRVAVDIVSVGQPMAPSQERRHGQSALLRKIADRSEVRPGDVVGYTILLKNNTDQPFRNVRIEDRLDGALMRIVGAQGAEQEGDRLLWTIPELAPGQSWSTRYNVQISSSAPQGYTIDNVVTASGEGLEPLSLTERVFTTHIGVIRTMPDTGAAFDAIFLLLSGMVGVGQTLFLRKKTLAGF
jgi:uncharacterized repeat protein (TIGR01451 family)